MPTGNKYQATIKSVRSKLIDNFENWSYSEKMKFGLKKETILYRLLNGQFLGKKISLETMCILESLMEFTPYWDKNITEKYVWPEQKKLIKNYQSVLTFNKSSYKVETINIVKEYTNEV